jgi:hypothetical protein
MRSFFFTLVPLALALGASGCAAASPSGKLLEARTLLDEARSRPTADAAAIVDAAEALEFAEFEERLSPGHRLGEVRAERALVKARTALLAAQRR